VGGGKGGEHQTSFSRIPDSAHSADTKIETAICKLTATPEGGNLVGVLRPIWIKAVESDMRLRWLRDMLGRGDVVREIQNFGDNLQSQLRVESSKE